MSPELLHRIWNPVDKYPVVHEYSFSELHPGEAVPRTSTSYVAPLGYGPAAK